MDREWSSRPGFKVSNPKESSPAMDAHAIGSISDFLLLSITGRMRHLSDQPDWSDDVAALLEGSALTDAEVCRDDVSWFVATEIENMVARRPSRDGSLASVLGQVCWPDVVLSLSFEQRPGRRAPGVAERDPLEARRAFADFYTAHIESITMAVADRVPRPDVDNEACVDDAAQSLIRCYWGPESNRRFLGLTPLRKLWRGVAIKRAKRQAKRIDARARKFREVKWQARREQSRNRVRPGDLASLLDEHGRLDILHKALANLPAAMRRYMEAHQFDRQTITKIAARYNVSKASVSKAITEALRRFQEDAPLLDALMRISEDLNDWGG
jgi:DNA-directed RNA polymerase specialized sigma24 family protein